MDQDISTPAVRVWKHGARVLVEIMSMLCEPLASIAPSKSDSAYILELVPTIGNGLAAITSASELLAVDRQDFSSTQIITFQGAPEGTNCLISGDVHGQNLLCSGTDGVVAIFDVRSQKRVSHFKIGSFDSDVHGPTLRLI